MISQNWFRYWFDAISQQAIIWANNADADLCCQMLSLGHKELIVQSNLASSLKTIHYQAYLP